MRENRKEIEMKTKIRKIKDWFKDEDNAVAVGYVAFVVAYVAGCGWLIKKAVDAQQAQLVQQAAEQAKWRDVVAQAVSDGKTVLPGPNGGYWVIDNKS